MPPIMACQYGRAAAVDRTHHQSKAEAVSFKMNSVQMHATAVDHVGSAVFAQVARSCQMRLEAIILNERGLVYQQLFRSAAV